jgi:AmmeMemoRadiSam system protein B
MARPSIRPAAVAGAFYPADPRELRVLVEGLLAAAAAGQRSPYQPQRLPAAIIAPHAGYRYSGPIAASAFSALRASGVPVRRVILVGPSHFVPLRGLALPDADAFATPLGRVPLDRAGMAAVARLPQVSVRGDAHLEEHSLEVELPFLQVALGGGFELLPLVAGEAGGDEVADVLEVAAWSRRGNGGEAMAGASILVISSDLSHYLPAARAEEADRATAEQIQSLRPPLAAHQACGAVPINGLLEAARRRGLQPRLLDLRHSGDTSGDRSRVVGYGAWSFESPDA